MYFIGGKQIRINHLYDTQIMIIAVQKYYGNMTEID